MFKFLSRSYGLRYSNNAYDFGLFLLRRKCLAKRNRLCYSQQHQESITVEHTVDRKFVPFLKRVEERRLEARKSIVVQVQSAQSYKELQTYCGSFGTVQQMFHYTTGVEPLHYIIVEFAKEDDVRNILSLSSYIEETSAVPTLSHFLWFKASSRKLPKLKQSNSAKLSQEDGTKIVKESEVQEILRDCESISDQMKTLYEITKLNDVGTRLRFLTALQLESSVSGMFPQAVAYPFGSSVNGYGRMGCDLDLVLSLTPKQDFDESRLIFHSKAASGSERTMNQRHMEAISDLLQLFLPGCRQVRRILQARIPIIKFHQQLADVECDLSMSNLSGVCMSDFLYLMGEVDDRVRPLVFTVRRWAKAAGLTNSSPGRWITNFSLTLMVLAFLQKNTRSTPILPSLNDLVKLAGPEDRFVTEDGINCTFLRDLNKYNVKITNTESLELLLKGFFEYYAKFDFTTKAICLNEAVSMTKPEFSAMYIVNPLERGLNVSKNVSLEEVERFKTAVRTATWTLESQEGKVSNWGVLGISEDNKVHNLSHFAFATKQHRLMNVRTLFEDGEGTKGDVEYKNPESKKQVEQIKKNSKAKLKSLQNRLKNER